MNNLLVLTKELLRPTLLIYHEIVPRLCAQLLHKYSTRPPDVFPLTPIVKKSCKSECCVNEMLQIIKNMMVSQGLELELSMSRRTTISG